MEPAIGDGVKSRFLTLSATHCPSQASAFATQKKTCIPESRACLKNAFCKMCVTICGRFRPDEGAVAGYGNRIRVKYTAKWGVQIAGMIFQTRSKPINVLTASKRILPFPGRKGGALAAGTSIIVLYVFFKDSFTSQVFRFFS